MLRGAVLEAASDRVVRGRPHLVRLQALEEVALAEQHPHVRPEELVRRAEEHVDVPAGDVDRAVRAVVDGVRPGERAGAVRELDDPRHVGSRADRVRRDREGDDARPLGELRLEVVEVEREVVVHAREADDDADVLREREPRGDVGVVVEPGAEDLVTRLQRAPERAREQEVERGHARPEGDLARVALQEAAGGVVRALDQLDRADARLVRARRCSRCPRGGSPRSRRSPRPGTGCRRARRRTPACGRAPSSGPERPRRPASSRSSELLSVDGPAVAGLRGQRGADEAVALGLRDQLAHRRRCSARA